MPSVWSGLGGQWWHSALRSHGGRDGGDQAAGDARVPGTGGQGAVGAACLDTRRTVAKREWTVWGIAGNRVGRRDQPRCPGRGASARRAVGGGRHPRPSERRRGVPAVGGQRSAGSEGDAVSGQTLEGWSRRAIGRADRGGTSAGVSATIQRAASSLHRWERDLARLARQPSRNSRTQRSGSCLFCVGRNVETDEVHVQIEETSVGPASCFRGDSWVAREPLRRLKGSRPSGGRRGVGQTSPATPNPYGHRLATAGRAGERNG